MTEPPAGALICFVCRKALASFWTCVTCERAGLTVRVCSTRCKHVHGRDGRHRKELKAHRG